MPVKKVSSKKNIKQKRKPRRRIRVFRVLIVVLVLVLIMTGLGNLYFKMASKAVDSSSKQTILVDIPKGATAKKIAQILKQKDLIKNERVFVSNVKNSEKAQNIKAGKYDLSKSMDNNTIISELLKVSKYQDGIKVVIPEGSLSTEIVDQLVKKNLGKRENFVKLFREPEEFSKSFVFLKDKKIKTLEGFLYPETYYFKKGTSEKEIFTKMLKEFEKNYNKSVKSYVDKNKLDFYDVVIMASIVEKETVKDSDRDIVAGIFYNRLDKKMKLQSDAVLQYGLPKRKSRVLYADLKVETPYNLYIHSGLPPTPIASPGVKSLIAAANPKKTDYLYFVTNIDGTNSYSKTFDKHKENAKKFHSDRDEQNKQKSEATTTSKDESNKKDTSSKNE